MDFSGFSGDFREFIGGISIFVWVEESVRLAKQTGVVTLQWLSTSGTGSVNSTAARVEPECRALKLWGGASQSSKHQHQGVAVDLVIESMVILIAEVPVPVM